MATNTAGECTIARANAMIGRQRDEAEELKLRNGGLHAENASLLTESLSLGEKVVALTRLLDSSKAEINSLREDGAALKELLAKCEAKLKAPLFKGGGAAATGDLEIMLTSKEERPAGNFEGKHKTTPKAPLFKRGGAATTAAVLILIHYHSPRGHLRVPREQRDTPAQNNHPLTGNLLPILSIIAESRRHSAVPVVE